MACFALRGTEGKRRAKCALCDIKGREARKMTRGKVPNWGLCRSGGRRQAMILAYDDDPGIPECACGCGEQVTFSTSGKPNQFFPPHAKDDKGRYCEICLEHKPWPEFTDHDSTRAQCRECKNALQYVARDNDEQRARNHEAWLRREAQGVREYEAKFGSLPECACGCGQRVKVGSDQQPRTFVKGHHLRNWDNWGEHVAHHEALGRERRGDISREELYDQLRKLKEERGLTWYDLDDMIGKPNFHISIRSKRVKAFPRDDVIRLLRALAGEPRHAVDYQKEIKEILGVSRHKKHIDKTYDPERRLAKI